MACDVSPSQRWMEHYWAGTWQPNDTIKHQADITVTQVYVTPCTLLLRIPHVTPPPVAGHQDLWSPPALHHCCRTYHAVGSRCSPPALEHAIRSHPLLLVTYIAVLAPAFSRQPPSSGVVIIIETVTPVEPRLQMTSNVRARHSRVDHVTCDM